MRCHSDAFGRVGRRRRWGRRGGWICGRGEPVRHEVGPRVVGPREVGRVDHGLSRTVKEETTVPISFWRCS